MAFKNVPKKTNFDNKPKYTSNDENYGRVGRRRKSGDKVTKVIYQVYIPLTLSERIEEYFSTLAKPKETKSGLFAEGIEYILSKKEND